MIECRGDDREHRRERGPQLVAQLGQECVLGPIGLLGRDPGRLLRLCPRLGGDVADDHQPSWFAAVREARDSDIVGEPSIPRVRAEAIRQLRSSFQPREVLGDLQPSRDHVARETDDVLTEASHEAKGSPVHARDPPPGIDHDDRVEHLVQDQGIAHRSDVDEVEPPQQHQAEHAGHHESGGRKVIFPVWFRDDPHQVRHVDDQGDEQACGQEQHLLPQDPAQRQGRAGEQPCGQAQEGIAVAGVDPECRAVPGTQQSVAPDLDLFHARKEQSVFP